MKGHEFFEHTADIGLKISGRDLPELFTHAAEAFLDLVTDPDEIREIHTVEFQLKAEDAGELLLKWLRELLYFFSAKGMLFASFDFKILNEHELQAAARGEVFSPPRHESRHEVKAVTYHGFHLRKNSSGFTAEVIVDI